MKNIIAKLACVLLSLSLLAGCESTSPNQTAATNPGKVVILFGKPPKAYVELGPVSALKAQPVPGETWQDALQKQAAGLGADAIKVDPTALDNPTANFVSGTAIRYQ
jgi:hypothetical protein